MDIRRREDRLYTLVVLAFLGALVALGLFGVPALLVAAIGAAVATVGIVGFRRALEGGREASPRPLRKHQDVPEKYVPRVLESGSMRRRRPTIHLRRHRGASALRFRVR